MIEKGGREDVRVEGDGVLEFFVEYVVYNGDDESGGFADSSLVQ